MAMRTIDHLYNTYAEAVQAVADLTRAGVRPDAISLIESDSDPRLPREVADDPADDPVMSTASLGATILGGVGLLDGIGSITIPGTEALAETGWVIPLVVFAVIGGVLGAMLGAVLRARIRNRKAHVLAAGLQRGKHLVMAQVDERDAAKMEAIMSVTRLQKPGVSPAYDMEPVRDDRTVAQEKAAIQREEQRLDHEFE